MRGNPVNWTDPSGEFVGLVAPWLLGALGQGVQNDLRTGGTGTLGLLQALNCGNTMGAASSALALMQPTLETYAKMAVVTAVGVTVAALSMGGIFIGAAALGITSPVLAGAAALIGSGIISGQASRATMNMLNGQAWNTGLFQLSDMLVDGALSILPFKLLGGSLAKFGAQGLRFGNQTVAAAKNAFNNLQNWVTNNFDLGAVTSGGFPVPKNRSSGVPYTQDQVALQRLVKEETAFGSKPLSVNDAETIMDWAQEYSYPGFRASPGDLSIDPAINNWAARPIPHIHIPGTVNNGHVPVAPGVKPR